MASQGIVDFVAPTPCHQEIEGKTLWGYPALCLVQHDEGQSYSVRWLTEHVGLTFPEHKRPASFGLRDTVEGYPVHSKSQTTLDGQDNSREGSYDTPRTFSPNQPSSPQGERTRANYAGVLDIPAHLDDAQKYRLRSFLYRGRTALTGTIVRTYQDPKDGRSRRYSSIELVIRSPEVEEFFKSGRKSSGGIDNDYVIRSDPVPFLLYSFYLKDRESRGGVIDVSLILVHDSFEELLVRQEEILTELGKLKEWLEAKAEEKYKKGGVLSREEENALRNLKARRPLAELIGPCPEMPSSPIKDSEAPLDHHGGNPATQSPKKSLTETKFQGSPKTKESFPSDVSPFRREFTAPFPGAESRSGSNAVECEGADLDPNADDSTSQPARSPTTLNPPSQATPLLKFPYLNYVIHCAFEYILNRVFSPDAKCKEQKIDDLAIQASALMTKDRNDSYQTVRSLWGLVRPSTSALEVIARSSHQRGMGKPGLTFNEIGTLLRALFRGNQIVIISQNSPSDANDFAIALSAFLPPGLATVLLGAHTYRPSYECNILTFSEEFYSTYEIQRHRTFTLSGKEQFVLAEELDQHSVCVSIDPIGFINIPADGPSSPEEPVVSDPAIGRDDVEKQNESGNGLMDSLHPLQSVAVTLHSLEQADELAKGTSGGVDVSRGEGETVKHSYIVRKVIPRIMNIPPEDTAELWEEDIRLTEQEIIQDVAAFATLGKLYVELLSTWAANKPLQAVRSTERARANNTPAGRTATQLAAHREQRPNTSILNRMLNWVSNVGHPDRQQQPQQSAQQQSKEVESTTPIARSERTATSVRDLTDQDISLMTASLGLESCDHDVLRYLASKPRMS
jgi:hypothetical protein